MLMLCIFTKYYFCYVCRHSLGMDAMKTLSAMLYIVVGKPWANRNSSYVGMGI